MMIALLLPLFVVGASAIVCTPNFCDRVDCANGPLVCGDGYVKEKGSFCGCCDTCITYVDEGGHCPGPLMGVPHTTECRPGLFCNQNTFQCESAKKKREVQTCAEKREEVLQKLQDNPHIVGLVAPTCDKDGNYEAVQCRESVCLCVDKSGQRLKNYLEFIRNRPHISCACAREEDDLKNVVGKTISCQANGNYSRKQCTGSRCYCVDEKTGQQIGESVAIGHHDSLNC